MKTKTKFEGSKRLRKADGTIAHVWEGKLHNWDGPALIPEGKKSLSEYYLYGIKQTEDEWREKRSQRTGLPWFKDPKYTNPRNQQANG